MPALRPREEDRGSVDRCACDCARRIERHPPHEEPLARHRLRLEAIETILCDDLDGERLAWRTHGLGPLQRVAPDCSERSTSACGTDLEELVRRHVAAGRWLPVDAILI